MWLVARLVEWWYRRTCWRAVGDGMEEKERKRGMRRGMHGLDSEYNTWCRRHD